MKKTSTVIAAMILLAACSKNEFQTPISSNQVYEGRIRPGEKVVKWDKPQGTFPNKKTITYNQYRITPYETFDGSKFYNYLIDPKKANRGDTIKTMKFGDDYQVGYGNQLDTVVSWKTLSGGSFTIFKTKNKNEIVTATRAEDRYGNVSLTNTRKIVTELSDSTKSKSATGTIIDTLEGNVTKWDYKTISDIGYIKDYKYPVSGIERFTSGSETKEINYGNGKKDNIATLSINGGKPEKQTLPIPGTPSLLGDD